MAKLLLLRVIGTKPALAIISGLACAGLLLPGCSEPPAPVAPAAVIVAHGDHATRVSGFKQEKGFIDGWFDGEAVNLFYTKLYFCAEPPTSGAPTDCVIGADAEVPPRGGPIPTIYALAAVGFQPDPSTLACRAGTPCLNHPAMIDASRVAGPGATNVPALPHSHILAEHRGGWFHTVNIRVFSLEAWNQIAAARSLAKVRELQGDPAVGRAGVISADTPTNIFFFIASVHK
jgi:hypothetical protein